MMESNDGLLLNVTQSNESTTFGYKKKNKFKRKSNESEPNRKLTHSRDAIELPHELPYESPTKSSDRIANTQTNHNERSSNIIVSSLFGNNPQIPQINMSKVTSLKEEIFSRQSFDDFNIHPHLVSCLKNRMGLTNATIVQQKSIPLLLKGSDALIKSVTGSGKTLAYAVPIMHTLQSYEPKVTRSDGIHAIVLVPTRELAIQSFELFLGLTYAFTRIVAGCLTGGEKRKSEKSRIRKGINILVSTPGRLIDHIEHTNNLELSRVKWFVIDEADLLLDQGFEESATKIVNYLKDNCNTKPQTVLLSATLTKGVERLAGMSLNDPEIIDISDQNMKMDSYSLPQNLIHSFLIIPAKLRLIALSSFIISKCSTDDKKILIFMITQDIVDFHHTLFVNIFSPIIQSNGLKNIDFFRLHGNMLQIDRVKVFQQFRQSRAGILFCTDVAARGLDLPMVDYILQFNCASKPEDYVHRVGRTARIGASGMALQFLLPNECIFLEELQKLISVNFVENDLKETLKSLSYLNFGKRIVNAEEFASHLQMTFENAVYNDDDLLQSAKRAYLSYLRAYSSYPKAIRDVLQFNDLHLGHLAKCFCLRESPKELGANAFVFRQKRTFNMIPKHNLKRRMSNIPMEARVSEYGSGLSDLRKTKRNKFNNSKV